MLKVMRTDADNDSRGLKRDWTVSNNESFFTDIEHSSFNKRVKSTAQSDYPTTKTNGARVDDTLVSETLRSRTLQDSRSERSEQSTERMPPETGCRLFTLLSNPSEHCLLATACARLLGMQDLHALFGKYRKIKRQELGDADKASLVSLGILLAKHARRPICFVTVQSVLDQFKCDSVAESAALARRLITPNLAISNVDTPAVTNTSSATLQEGPPSGDDAYQDAISDAFNNKAAARSQEIQDAYDMLSRPEVLAVPRPRIETTGVPFVDKSQPTSSVEIQSQAAQIAEFSKVLNTQRRLRATLLKQEYATEREVPKLNEIIPGIPCINFVPEDSQILKQTAQPGSVSNNQKLHPSHPGPQAVPGITPGRTQPGLNQLMPNGTGQNAAQRNANMAAGMMNPLHASVSPGAWGSGPAGSPPGPVFQHRHSLTAMSPPHAQSPPSHVPLSGHLQPNQSAPGLQNHAPHVAPNLGNFQHNIGPARAMLGHPQMNLSQIPPTMTQRSQILHGSGVGSHAPNFSQPNWDAAQF